MIGIVSLSHNLLSDSRGHHSVFHFLPQVHKPRIIQSVKRIGRLANKLPTAEIEKKKVLGSF